MSNQIQLTQGKVAVVCDCCIYKVNTYKWIASFNKPRKLYYAYRNASVEERKHGIPKIVLMHRVINNTPKGMETDHINGNTLDNQCSNLRTVTHSQNMINRKKQSNNTTGITGVYYNEKTNRWRSQIWVNGKKKELGVYLSKEKAQQARSDAEKELHGVFARISAQ